MGRLIRGMVRYLDFGHIAKVELAGFAGGLVVQSRDQSRMKLEDGARATGRVEEKAKREAERGHAVRSFHSENLLLTQFLERIQP